MESVAARIIGLSLAQAVTLAHEYDMEVEVLAVRDGFLSANMDLRSDRLRVTLDADGVVRSAMNC